MRRLIRGSLIATLVAVASGACAATSGSSQRPATLPDSRITDPFPSTYQPLNSRTTVIRGGTLLTAAGPAIANGQILVVDGRIAAVGDEVQVPQDAVVIDATGKFITPGIIDAHSHLGVGPTPRIPSLSDTNEMTDPVTAQVWAEHSIWPQDPGFPRALAGGVTSLQILPGSGNLIGGRTVTIRNVPARTVQQMKFPGAPHGMKMACGENPKRVYGGRGVAPSTNMANVAGYRNALIRAMEYDRQWDAWEQGGRPAQGIPSRDLQLETLAGVLNGQILVHIHCYRADEMAQMIDVADEFDFSIRTFEHAVEAYKVPTLLISEGIAISAWADWWGFKMEAMDAVVAGAAMFHGHGGRVSIHSDDAHGIQRLNQEAAKALAAGREAGLEISDAEAIRWITANPAWALGIDDEVGTLESGKRADVVIWSGNPFSVYSVVDQVFVDGALLYDRSDPSRQPTTDFEIGFTPTEHTP
jgi:imidazolonepropionase-like amidohydrolase